MSMYAVEVSRSAEVGPSSNVAFAFRGASVAMSVTLNGELTRRNLTREAVARLMDCSASRDSS